MTIPMRAINGPYLGRAVAKQLAEMVVMGRKMFNADSQEFRPVVPIHRTSHITWGPGQGGARAGGGEDIWVLIKVT